MARQLTLQRYELQNANYQQLGAFRLRVEASAPFGTDTDPNVFLYLRRPTLHDGTVEDEFQTIASPVDMTEYAVGAPKVSSPFPFYRLSYVELDLRASSLAEEVWQTIVADVNNLLLAQDRLELLVPTLTVDVGTRAPSPTSASSTTSGTSASSGSSGSSQSG